MDRIRSASAKATTLDWAFLIALGLIWGMSFLATKIALNGFGPITIAAARLGIGALILIPIALFMGVSLIPALAAWPYLLSMGLISNSIPFLLLNWGQLSVTSAFAAASMAFIPIIILSMSALFFKKAVTLGQCGGVFIGFVGLILLIGVSDIMRGIENGALLPKLACIMAATCYGAGGVILRMAPPSVIHPIQFSAMALAIGAGFTISLALWLEGLPNIYAVGSSFGALIYLGGGSTALATILLVRVINSAGPAFLGLVNYQVPLWSVLASVFILGEMLPSNFFLALGFILVGLFVSEFLAKKR